MTPKITALFVWFREETKGKSIVYRSGNLNGTLCQLRQSTMQMEWTEFLFTSSRKGAQPYCAHVHADASAQFHHHTSETSAMHHGNHHHAYSHLSQYASMATMQLPYGSGSIQAQYQQCAFMKELVVRLVEKGNLIHQDVSQKLF